MKKQKFRKYNSMTEKDVGIVLRRLMKVLLPEYSIPSYTPYIAMGNEVTKITIIVRKL